MVIDAQLCECIKSQWIVHFKWVNWLTCELCLKKSYFKREGQLLAKFDSNKLDKSQANQQTHLSLLSPPQAHSPLPTPYHLQGSEKEAKMKP